MLSLFLHELKSLCSHFLIGYFIEIIFQLYFYLHTHSLQNNPITLLHSQGPPPCPRWLVGNGCGFLFPFITLYISFKHSDNLLLFIYEVNVSPDVFTILFSLGQHHSRHWFALVLLLKASLLLLYYPLPSPVFPAFLSLDAVWGDGCGFCRWYPQEACTSSLPLSCRNSTETLQPHMNSLSGQTCLEWDIWQLVIITAFILSNWTDAL